MEEVPASTSGLAEQKAAERTNRHPVLKLRCRRWRQCRLSPPPAPKGDAGCGRQKSRCLQSMENFAAEVSAASPRQFPTFKARLEHARRAHLWPSAVVPLDAQVSPQRLG